MTAGIAAIVLAAGRGSRFGAARNKLLEDFDGRPLLRRAVDAALASRASETIVVTGWERARIETELAGLPLTLVHNKDYASGMASSLRAGLAQASRAMGVLVLLADMPKVTSAILDRLIATFETTGALVVIPTHGAQRGNPVLLGRALFPRLAGLRGDNGARDLLHTLDGVVELDIQEDAILTDVDTPRDIDALRRGER
jgi:molybdenum cofactor cytidylyltransferase